MAKKKPKQGAGKGSGHPPKSPLKEDLSLLPSWNTHDVKLPRLERETVKAYGAFVAYSNTDPKFRSLRKLTTALGKRQDTTCKRWSVKYEWQKRVAVFDRAVYASSQRLFWEHEAQHHVGLLIEERAAQSLAKRALTEDVVIRLVEVVNSSDAGHSVAASNSLIKIAAHAPDRPTPPPRVGAGSSSLHEHLAGVQKGIGANAAEMRALLNMVKDRKAEEALHAALVEVTDDDE